MPNDIDQSQVQWDNSQQPDNGIDPSQVQWESDVSGDLESMHLASDVPPDQAARFKKLSDSTGASFNAVKDDPASAEKQAELPAWKKFAQDAPKAAKHLASDPVSFQVLKNDVQKLAEVEQSRSAGNNDPQKHGLTDLVKGGLSPLSFSALQKDVIDAYSYFKIEEHQAWLRHLDAVEKSKSWDEARQEVDRIRSMPQMQQYSEFHNLTGKQVTDSHLDRNKNLRNSYEVLDAVAGGIGRRRSREERAKYPEADKTYNAERAVLGEMSQEKAADVDAMKVKGLAPYSPAWFVQEGLGSVAQTGKSIATASVPGLGIPMFYGSVGGAYLNDKEHANLSDADKLEGARVHAAAEYLGESIGTNKLLDVIKDSGLPALKKWMYAAIANGTEEHATEIITQTYDAAKNGEIPGLSHAKADKAGNMEKTLAFIDGQLQAYVLGAIGGGAAGVGGSAVQSTGKAIVGRIDARNEAKRQAVIDKHNSLLGEVQKVEEMDATHLDSVTVRNALESMDDSERSLYVDPSQLLNQEGLSRQQLDELIPSAADQIDQALQVGGLVQVPRNELITNLAATKDLDNESITRHFKEDVANDSKFEMEMAGINNQIKQADILIANSADSEKLKTQRSEVYQQALDDLNNSGMFKGGNDKRAAIWAAMATATAMRTGKTPMELYKETFGRVTDDAAIGDAFNQTAYHGSPYQFDKFSLDHIGKGEGAQAYGHGLYFAGNKEVAEYYKEKLTEDAISSVKLTEKTYGGERAWRAEIEYKNGSSAIEIWDEKDLSENLTSADADNIISRSDNGDYLDGDEYDARSAGQLYKVDIPEDDTYLLWDKPLSEQSEKVREALTRAGVIVDGKYGDGFGATPMFPGWSTFTGESIHRRIVNREFEKQREVTAAARKIAEQAASKYLHSIGIRGIRYLDGSSRSAGDGNYNYVIFDDNAVKIIDKFYQNKAIPRGTYDPATRNINLTHNADLSTFLHESGHMFLDIMADMAVSENASESLKKDMDVTMKWFGIEGDTPEMRLYNWRSMTINEKRQFHEKWAESFEQYLFEGKAPSIELAHVFSTFRQWLMHVYKSIAQFVASHDGAKLNDEVRGVFDRMLATEEQIQEAEAARGLLPLFDKKPDNMTDAEWKVMQQAAEDSARSAFDQMTARSLRDMKWLSNAKNKTLRKLQREADEQRREARMEARQQILSQPIYRAWQFLKAPVEGAKAANQKAKASKDIDSSRDSLLTAIAKLGGLNMEQAVSQYGLDSKDFHHKGGMFGMPVLRKTGGMSPDAMGEALSQYGYLPLDEHGKWDIQDLEDKLREEAAGNPQYSDAADYDVLLGDSRYAEAPTPEEVDFVGGRLSRTDIREMYDDADLAGMQGEQVDTEGKLLQEEKYNPDLFVAHNLSEENLIHADELGGLAAPSLGISRTTTGGFDGYGEITLLADPSITQTRDARTFNADVYSPRHPRAVYKIDSKKLDEIYASLDAMPGRFTYADADEVQRYGAESLAKSDAMKLLYLKEIGKDPKLKKAKVSDAVKKAAKLGLKRRWDFEDSEAFQKIAAEYWQADLDKYIAAITESGGSQERIDKAKAAFYDDDGKIGRHLIGRLAIDVTTYIERDGVDVAALSADISKQFRTKAQNDAYSQWVDQTVAPALKEKRIKVSPSKTIPYTLDNIVSMMTRELRGGEGFNYGAGNIRAMNAQEIKSIQELKNRRGEIVSSKEMEELKKESQDRLMETMEQLKPFYKYDANGWGYYNDASSAIADGPRGWGSAFKINKQSESIIKGYISYLKNLPTEYFETKMQRAVGIGEFKTAVVPKGISARAMAILEKNGLNVVAYDPKKEGARTAAIAKQKDILFQPNGKDSGDNRTLESMGVLSDEGLHPDTVADLFGLSSGDELVRKLLTVPDPVKEIERLTDEIMLQRHADLATPEARERAAEAAIHNEAHVRFLATELTALNRAIGKPRLVMAAAREYAAQIVSSSLIKDLNTGKYEAAEVKAGRAAEQAFRSGNKNEAALQKRNQVLHAMTVKMVNDAKGEMEKHLAYLKKFDKFNKKIDPDYQEQIDTLLERYDLRKKSMTDIKRSQNLGQWIEQQKAMGLEPVIPDKLLDESQRTNYKLLTVEEMRGLVDAVKNIEHLGRLKNRLLTDKAKRELNALADAVGKSISDNGGAVKPVKIERNSTMDRLSDLASGFFSMHRKLASIVRQLDGWKDGGLLWETMIRPMNEAGDNEAVMHEKSTLALAEVFAPLKGKKLTKKMYIPMIANSLSYEGRLAVALNWGNEGNRQRLMDGDKWGVGEVNAILATLTADDWKFVQGVWDHIATYKEAIGEQQKRLTGIEPSWVDPAPFEIKTADGQTVQVQGGYYPVKYDTTRSTQALSNEAAGNVFDQWKAAKGQGKTRDGFTKSRATQVIDRPLRKDFGVITQHITEVTHRLAWQDWVVDMNRLLKKEQVDSSIRAHYGNEILEEMRKAIEDITTGDMTAQSSFEKAINHLRIGTTIVGLGYNLTTSLLQPFGLTQSMVRIGPKWVAKGLSTWIGNPARMNERTEWVYSKSDFMRLRGKTMMREMNEILNSVRKEKMSKLEASYFYGIQKMQIIADMPTWLGQYEKSMAEFDGDESKAIALADQAVLDAQGGGQNKDLSRIQRGGPLLKLWTNFYSFFNTTYNLTREVVGRTDVKDPASVAKAAVDMLLLYSIPSVMGSILKGVIAGDDDDDELAYRILRDQMSYLFGTMVGLREISAAFSGFNGYQGPAGTRFFSEVAKFGKQVGQGEADAAFLKSLNNIGGIIFHYPAGQINRTVEGANALMDGETDNMSALIFGKPK